MLEDAQRSQLKLSCETRTLEKNCHLHDVALVTGRRLLRTIIYSTGHIAHAAMQRPAGTRTLARTALF
jgi:hypothetical protein